jgi:transposase-like protein
VSYQKDLTKIVPHTDLTFVKTVLDSADTIGVRATSRQYGIHYTALGKWKQIRAAHGGNWPTPAHVAEQQERQNQNTVRRARQKYRRVNGNVQVPSLGTARRLQALRALGYRLSDLAPLLGVTKARVAHLSTPLSAKVGPNTVATVNALYDRLHMTPAPGPTHVVERLQREAVTKGWAVPLAWIGDMDDPDTVPLWSAVRAA